MNTNWAGSRYWTTAVQDDDVQGCAGLRLHEESNGIQSVVAEVIFWDASGHFYVQTMNREVPLDVIESLIAETKAHVRIR